MNKLILFSPDVVFFLKNIIFSVNYIKNEIKLNSMIKKKAVTI